jgi:hypothetical protein
MCSLWQPPRRYETVFFAFWLTHVPPVRFANFWSMVGTALTPGGRGLLRRRQRPRTRGRTFCPDQATPAVWRRLGDGSEHRVVKVYYTPGQLTARLAELGWSADVRKTSTPLLVGTARTTSDF